MCVGGCWDAARVLRRSCGGKILCLFVMQNRVRTSLWDPGTQMINKGVELAGPDTENKIKLITERTGLTGS